MSNTGTVQSPAKTARLIHASLILGQVLFAGVTFFQVRPNAAERPPLSDLVLYGVFGAIAVACGVSLILRRGVPQRSSSTSPDVFWSTAAPKAMTTWVPLEMAGLLALVVYFQSLSTVALAAAAIPILLLAALNPWYLERT